MEIVENNELKEIKGGGVNWGLMAGFSAFASFLIGIVYCYIQPKRC